MASRGKILFLTPEAPFLTYNAPFLDPALDLMAPIATEASLCHASPYTAVERCNVDVLAPQTRTVDF